MTDLTNIARMWSGILLYYWYILWKTLYSLKQNCTKDIYKNIYSSAVLNSPTWKPPSDLYSKMAKYMRACAYSDAEQQMRMNSLQVYTTLWMDLTNITSSEISQT